MTEPDRAESVEHIERLLKTDEEADLMVELISNFDLKNTADISQYLYKVLKSLPNELTESPETVAFAAKHSKKSGFDSSKTMLGMLANNVPTELNFSMSDNIYETATDALENPEIKHLVLIDDFSGTGRALETYVKWVNEKCDSIPRDRVKVHAFFFRALPATTNRVFVHRPCTLEIEAVLSKGISDYFKPKSFADKQIKVMETIEKSHGNVGSFSLGFGQSECLYACTGLSTPNNVFPIFWKKRAEGLPFHRPLLRRKQ